MQPETKIQWRNQLRNLLESENLESPTYNAILKEMIKINKEK